MRKQIRGVEVQCFCDQYCFVEMNWQDKAAGHETGIRVGQRLSGGLEMESFPIPHGEVNSAFLQGSCRGVQTSRLRPRSFEGLVQRCTS